MAIHEAGWTVQGAQLGKEESWGCKEQVCSLRVCTEGLVAQGPLPGRNLYPAWLSIELDIARQPLLSSSYQRLLYHLPRDRHGQPLGKDGPRKRLHVPRSRKLQPQQVRWPHGHGGYCHVKGIWLRVPVTSAVHRVTEKRWQDRRTSPGSMTWNTSLLF